MHRLVTWYLSAPDPGMDFDTWLVFCNALAIVVIFFVVVTVGVIVYLYSRSAYGLKIRRVEDVFRPYTPLGWLALSPFAGLAIFIWYYFSFRATFPDVPDLWIGGAGLTFIFAMLMAVAIAYVIMCWRWYPYPTPVKFRYRPLPPFLRR